MKIMYVASEVAPFIKTGGLGDVAGSLPNALAAEGHDVAVFCPYYSLIPQQLRDKMEYLKNAYVQLGWRNQYCGIFVYKQKNVKYYFIDNEYYFSRSQIYGEYDDAERFAFFCKAVLEILPDIDFCPDIINCNDWQTALIPVYYNLIFSEHVFYKNIKTVFTIHNIAYQGRYGREILEYVLGIDEVHYMSGFMAMDGDVNLMKAAIIASNAVSTVSPTYAREIQTPYYGHGLDSILRDCSYKLHGILNGLDLEKYNPQTDPYLFENYNANNPSGKKKNKKELLNMCGLEGNEKTPVIAIISRFASHKGLDLIEAVLDQILQDDIRLIVLGKGEWRYEQMFIDAKRKYPGKISLSIMFSADFASKIYAGSDILLMPSKSEPCGLAQMIALHYGTIPVVRETGGLKDTVHAFVDYLGTGNGFTFHSYNAHDMLHVIREACGVFKYGKSSWEKLISDGMKEDFSWNLSAKQYLELYNSI